MKLSPDKLGKLQLVVFVFIVSVCLILAGYMYYKHERNATRDAKYKDLSAIARMKNNQLANWYSERLSEASFFSSTYPYTDFATNIMQGNNEDEARLRSTLMHIMLKNKFENIFLLDATGTVMFSVQEDFTSLDDTSTIHYLKEVFVKKENVFHDFFYSREKSDVHMDILTPVKDNNQNVIAAMVFRIDPDDYLYPLINEWPTPRKTAETVFVRRDGNYAMFLNNVKHAPKAALEMKVSLANTIVPAVSAVLGYEGLFEGEDYAGKIVLSDISSVPNTPWFMVVKMDREELYNELNKRAILILIVTILAIFFISAAVAWIYNRRQRNIFKELSNISSELYKAQEAFGTTLYSIGDGVIATDHNGNIKNLNPVAETLTGWKEKDALGRSIIEVFNIINEDTRDKVENPVHKVIREGAIVGLANHTLLISRDGVETPIANSGAPIRDQAGNLQGVVMVFTDQTKDRFQNKLLQIRLNIFEFANSHSLEETLTKMLDEIAELTQSPVGFIHLMKEDQETILLQAWSTITKTSFYNIIENWGMEGMWTDCLKSRKAIIHNAHENDLAMPGTPHGLSREMVIPIFRENKIVAILGFGNKPCDYSKEDLGISSFLGDVIWELAENKRKQESIKEKERHLSSLISHLPGFVYRCKYDKDWTIIFISDRCGAITGYEPNDFTYSNKIAFNNMISKSFHADIYKEWDRIIADKSFFEMEYQITTATGEIKWVWERGRGVFDSNDQLLFLEGYIEDITQSKNIELKLMNKMSDLEKFNRVMIGRENKMIELKKEINDLLLSLDKPLKYTSPQSITGETYDN